MTGESKPPPSSAGQLRCIECGALMVLAHVEPGGTDELRDASAELRRNLYDLQEKLENVRRYRKEVKVKDLCGFRTEIHHALAHVADIAKQLGSLLELSERMLVRERSQRKIGRPPYEHQYERRMVVCNECNNSFTYTAALIDGRSYVMANEAALYTKLSKHYIRLLARQGDLPSIHSSAGWLIDKEALQSFLTKRTIDSSGSVKSKRGRARKVI